MRSLNPYVDPHCGIPAGSTPPEPNCPPLGPVLQDNNTEDCVNELTAAVRHRRKSHFAPRRLTAIRRKIRLRTTQPDRLTHCLQTGLRAGMTEAVVSEIGPRGRIIGFEAAEAVGIVAVARLTVGDGTTDDCTRGKPANHSAGTIVATPPTTAMPAMMPPTTVMPAMMTPAHRLRRSSRSGKRSVDRQRRRRRGLKRNGRGTHHERGGQDFRKSHEGFPFLSR